MVKCNPISLHCLFPSHANDNCSYRKFPGWVHLILIRKVTEIAEVGLQEKNEPQRFETAFEGVPASVWYVFENPEECYQIIKEIVAKDS
jgi:hypothetical protein